jgi:hypothetical protein
MFKKTEASAKSKQNLLGLGLLMASKYVLTTVIHNSESLLLTSLFLSFPNTQNSRDEPVLSHAPAIQQWGFGRGMPAISQSVLRINSSMRLEYSFVVY